MTARELYDAAKNGRVKDVKALIASGVDVNEIKDIYDRETPLFVASYYGHLEVVKADVRNMAVMNIWIDGV